MTTIQEMVHEDIAKLTDTPLPTIEAALKATRSEYKALMQKEDIGLDENRRINFLIAKIEALEKLIAERKQQTVERRRWPWSHDLSTRR